MGANAIQTTVRHVAFLGGTRYSQPLDPTNAKKFRLLTGLGEIFVIGFAQSLKPCCFREFAHFYLLPKSRSALWRYLTMFAIAPLVSLWLVGRHGVRVLVAQSPYEGFAGACTKVVARWLGWPVVLIVESHTDFEETIFLQRKVRIPSLYRFAMRHAARVALKNADILRAVSIATRQQLQRWAPEKQIAQFMAWTDIEVFLNAKREPACDGRVAIVFVGVLIPRKCVHVLLEAFIAIADEFPEASLIIIGDAINSEYRRKLEVQSRTSSVHERIVFRAPMQQAELAAHLAQARALVLPSSSEGLGRVVLEAMACGIPVIGTAVGGIPDMIEDRVTGFLVPPGDVPALASRLRWVLGHAEECTKMGARARSFAARFFSPEAYLSSYRQICESAEAAIARGNGSPY